MFNTSARCSLGWTGWTLADIVLRSTCAQCRRFAEAAPRATTTLCAMQRQATKKPWILLFFATRLSQRFPSHFVARSTALANAQGTQDGSLGTRLYLSASPSRHQKAERQASMGMLDTKCPNRVPTDYWLCR